MRAACLALLSIPTWACATASYNDAPPDTLYAQTDNGGSSDASAGKTDVSSVAGGGAGGTTASGGSGNTSSTAGKGGSSSAGMGSGGTGNSGGRGGSSSAGASGGTSSGGSAGKGGSSSGGTGAGGTSSAGGSSGGSSSAGSNSAGASTGGSSGSATCDAAHAVATLTTNQAYTGTASDCVRLAVDKSWSVINVQLQPLPGTQGYPVPFSFFNCGGNGTGSLTTDYSNVTLKSGANPGCDFFVQFGGGETTIKVTYYD